jgi:RNA polymerase sigma-54 factor
MMNNSLNLSIRQQQTLKMSPQMIQSISLMSLSADELIDRIYEEAERNPALEIVKEASLQNASVSVKKSSSSASDSDAYQAFLESMPSRSLSLKEHLLSQLHLLPLSLSETDIGEKIINNLDEYGYHSVPLNELFPPFPSALVQKVLVRIQHFDPVGIACSGIQESLLLQVHALADSPLLAVRILSLPADVFEDVFSKPRPSLMLRKLQEKNIADFESVSQEDLEDALEYIKSLDPYPARQFSTAPSQFIIPDVRIRRASADEKEETGEDFIIELLNGVLPEIALSPEFEKMAQASKNTLGKSSTSKEDKDARKFAGDAVKDAQWFLRSIHQRNITLIKTVHAILRAQKLFFEKGSRFLSPLRMKDVADEIGVHEATVSRIASSKYIQCEWGTFEIKYFFTTAVASTTALNGNKTPQDHSKESVKEELRLLIEKEGSLSDQKLSDLLAQKGIKIARRTVAKYRTELNITSSFDRK